MFGALQLGALGFLLRTCRARTTTTSRVVGPVMGIGVLAYAAMMRIGRLPVEKRILS